MKLITPLLALGLLLTACRQQESPADATYAAKDLFPAKANVRHATHFSIRYHGNYKVIEVREPWRGAAKTFKYLLVQRGTPVPRLPGISKTVEIPVRSLVITSTTYAPYVAKLGLLNQLKGTTNPELINTPEVAARIKDGHIAKLGGSAGLNQDLNLEKLLMLRPEMILTHSTGSSEHDVYPQLQKAGIKVVLNASYMEGTPLGRTEWMTFIAAFFNKEKEAEALFSDIEAQYGALAAKASAVKKRPKVICNIAYKGTWHLPGGRSYVAKYLSDAGAEYPWAADTHSGSIVCDFEETLARAADADVWLNPGLCGSQQAMLAVDKRYKLFRPLKRGTVYNHTAKVNAAGGHDYWEGGTANPHLVLADMIKILHPKLLPEHKLIWYEKLKED